MAGGMGKVRWGVLSTASIGRLVIEATAQARSAEFVAVASRDAARARAFADELGLGLSFGSYEELLASEAVDAVYVALPVSMHAEWTVRSLEAGKHVLCEKPLALRAEDAERCFAAAAATSWSWNATATSSASPPTPTAPSASPTPATTCTALSSTPSRPPSPPATSCRSAAPTRSPRRRSSKPYATPPTWRPRSTSPQADKDGGSRGSGRARGLPPVATGGGGRHRPGSWSGPGR
jgi:hypothetical protein